MLQSASTSASRSACRAPSQSSHVPRCHAPRRAPPARHQPLWRHQQQQPAAGQGRLPPQAAFRGLMQGGRRVLMQQPEAQFVGVIGGMQTVKGSLLLDTDPELVYQLLTDYDNCHRVFSNIATSTTIWVDNHKRVVQACKWQFLALSGTFDIALDVTEEPDNRLLVFRLASSSFMDDFEGRWVVTPLPQGGCSVEHVLAVKPSMPIPSAIAQWTATLFTAQVKGLLRDLAAGVEREVAAGGSAPATMDAAQAAVVESVARR